MSAFKLPGEKLRRRRKRQEVRAREAKRLKERLAGVFRSKALEVPRPGKAPEEDR